MRHTRRNSITAIVGILVLVPASVSAHVTVSPTDAISGDYETFSVSVPNEQSQPTTGVRLQVPRGVLHVTPTVKPGWTIATTKNDDRITDITWTGGSIAEGLRDDFSFSAQTPATSGDVIWKAYQTYEDGTVVAWDQKPAAESDHDDDSNAGPYSVTKVTDQAADSQPQANSSSSGAYLIAGAALLVALFALTTTFRAKR